MTSSSKRKADQVDHVDQPGSRDGKRGDSSRETVHPAWSMRFTYEKVCDQKVDHWISGSSKTPDLIEVLKDGFSSGIVSLEKGENGQPHFQITVRDKIRKRREAVRKWLLTHYDELVFPKLD